MNNVTINNNRVEEKEFPNPVLLKNAEIIPTFEAELGNGTVHTALVRLEAKDLVFFPTKANPRSYNAAGSTTKKIKRTLVEEPELFEVLNRGITVVCDNLKFKDGEALFEFSSWSQGVVDGGHTMTTAIKAANSADEDIPAKHAKVTIKVMYGPGVVALASRISETFNTVEKVSQMSMNNLRGYFDSIKTNLKPTTYYEDIKWEQNDHGRISCNRIVGLLNSFDPTRWGQSNGIISQPTDSYNSASHTQLDVQKQYETKGFTTENPYYALSNVTAQIVELFEWVEHSFPMLYERNTGKKYVKLEVSLPTGQKASLANFTEGSIIVNNDGEKQTMYKTYFYGDNIPSYVPTSLIYAIIAPMRRLLERDKNGFYYFITDPIKMFELIGPSIVTRAINFYPKTWDPYNMMKDPNFWAALESVATEEMNKLK